MLSKKTNKQGLFFYFVQQMAQRFHVCNTVQVLTRSIDMDDDKQIATQFVDRAELCVVRKASAAIGLPLKYTIIERKLFNFLIFHAQQLNNTVSDQRQTVSYSEICKVIEWPSRNPEPMKRALVRLTEPIVWNEHGLDRTTKWTVCSLIQYGELDEGVLSYALNGLIAEKISRPRLFAKIALVTQREFKTVHSTALWEWAADELCRTSKSSAKITLSLSDVRHLFGLTGSTYESYKYLKRDVLDKAIKEINKHSELTVTFEPQRAGRKTVALLFFIKQKEVFPQLPIEFSDHETDASPGRTSIHSLTAELEGYGIQTHMARKLVRDHSEQRIRANIVYTEAQSIKRNKPGYLVKAIAENYAGHDNEKPVHNSPAAASEETVDESDFKAFKNSRVRSAFNELSREAQHELLNEFYDRAESGKVVGLEGWTRKSKKKKSMVEGLFFSELASQLLTQPHETNFDAFLKWFDKNLTA